MIWNDRFLFLHYPKTAGKSLSRYMLQGWERPLHGLISPGQVQELADCGVGETNIVVGRGHENLSQAKKIVSEYGKSLEDFEAIFVCIRNPYDLMVSNYHFMRKTFKNNKDKDNFRMACEKDFPTYCRDVGMSCPSNWMMVDGLVPENLEVIRFEQLNSDLERLSKKHSFSHNPLAKLNGSSHGHYASYMNGMAEKAVFKKFEYIFEHGFYQRESFPENPEIINEPIAV